MIHDTLQEFQWINLYIYGPYGARHRAYHTVRHLQDIFYTAKDLGITLTVDQKVAIYYHDVVYIPGCNMNEELSVLLLETHIAQAPEFFNLAFPNANVDVIKQIILDTKSHKATCEESKVVLDLDMVIMGQDAERYFEYVEEIKKEFAKFAGPQFDQGRAQFLNSIKDTRIFNLDLFHNRFNEQAQANIKAELLVMGL